MQKQLKHRPLWSCIVGARSVRFSSQNTLVHSSDKVIYIISLFCFVFISALKFNCINTENALSMRVTLRV
jgi:hypothetical protein